MKILSIIVLIFFFVTPVFAGESSGTVSCNSSSVGVQIVANLGGGTVVNVPSGSTTGIYVIKTNDTCATSSAVVAGAGYPIGPGNAYDFKPKEDGYTGQLCCILWTGSTAVTAGYNKR